MRAYIYSVLCASLVSGVLCTVAPEKNSLSKYISFACALAVALTVLSPFVNGTLNLSPESFFSEEEEASSSKEQGRKKAQFTAQSAAEVLCAACGVQKEALFAQADVAEDGTVAEIRIYGKDIIILQKGEMSEKLSEIFGVKITVFDKEGS